jgi:putative ABC transport system permease protein
MNDLFTLAFRNIFRNSRRSLLTVVMVLIAVMVIVLSSSFLSGMLSNMVEEFIRSSGHVRITTKDHDIQERKLSLYGGISNYSNYKKAIGNGARTVVGRLKFGSYIFKGDDYKEALGYGVEDNDFQNLKLGQITYQGQPLRPGSRDEILIGRQLAASLGLRIGDQVMLLVSTYYNSTWALNFKVVGFFDKQSSSANKSFYISLAAAQELLDMADMVTEIMVFGSKISATNEAAKILSGLKTIKELQGMDLKRWDEVGMAQALVKMLTLIYTVMQMIFVVLAGLGIANTMMMAIFERKPEIGLLKSLGMREQKIVNLFLMEGSLLGLLGTFIGLVFGGVGAYLMATKGINLGNSFEGLPFGIGNILYGGLNIGIFVKGLVLGFVAAFLATLVPVLSVVKIKPSEALRG